MGEQPKILDLMRSTVALDVFAPETWNGLKLEPIDLTLKEGVPDKLYARARPIRAELYKAAKKEYNRLCDYFYVDSDSSYASPLVIAPKATEPFIRFCGDYRKINEHINRPQIPIPIPYHELSKAFKFKIFADCDLANSFHQLPLSENTSKLLSVQTPWGLVRPKFLPEGVAPACGILQYHMRNIFAAFEDWTIVIFDNILILANDFKDLYSKMELFLERCHEARVVLKLKKTWIGYDTVTFFGYKVSNGTWTLSDARREGIRQFEFPTTKKAMQSFLGAALFFHHHIPNFSDWAAKLYEMTTDQFKWDRSIWTYDYEAHFKQFQSCLESAAVLHFPDYAM